jgi:hypothetical protein
MSLIIHLSGFKAKNTAPPPTKGSIKLLNSLGIRGSIVARFLVLPPTQETKGFNLVSDLVLTCLVSTLSYKKLPTLIIRKVNKGFMKVLVEQLKI